MRLYVDLDLRQVVTGLGVKQPTATLYFTRGDGASLDIQFTRDGAVIDPGCDSVFFVIKPAGVFDGSPLVLHTAFTKSGSGVTATWSGQPNFNNETLDAALGVGGAADVASITAAAEIGFILSGSQTTTRVVRAVIENDLYRGSELSPSAYPVGSAVTFYPTIVFLTDVVTISGAATAKVNGTYVFDGTDWIKDADMRVLMTSTTATIWSLDEEDSYFIGTGVGLTSPAGVATWGDGNIGSGPPYPVAATAPSLDLVSTVAVAVGVVVQFSLGGILHTWQLQAGTTAESTAGGIVRPNDYNASTNAKIWSRLA
jgi:hypothetical protein